VNAINDSLKKKKKMRIRYQMQTWWYHRQTQGSDSGKGIYLRNRYPYDLNKTYVEMMGLETPKILLIIALNRGWTIRQWDMVTAYPRVLDTYISNINGKEETEYWKLTKAVYGLNRLATKSFKILQKILHHRGLEQCTRGEGTYASSDKKTQSALMSTTY